MYDLKKDRDEVNNLANSPEHQEILKRLRKEQQNLALKIRDVGFLPEDEIHTRSQGSSPYEVGHDSKRYPCERVIATAEAASAMKLEALPELMKALQDGDSAVRYWGALGILMRAEKGVKPAQDALRKALSDSSPSVRIIAAEALGRYGNADDLKKALAILLPLAPPDKNGYYFSMLALNAIESFGKKAMPLKDAIKAMPAEDPNGEKRASGYVARLLESINENLA